MKIILNPDLVRIIPYREFSESSVTSFGEQFKYKLKGEKYLGMSLNQSVEALHLGFVGLLSRSYSNHEKLRIAPHDLWFVFLTEIAKIVNANSEICRDLFTNSNRSTEILVYTADPTTIDTLAVMEHLKRLVPSDTAAFMPSLSTATISVEIAMAAVFADMVQSYYSYGTFCCGIPEIDVTGTAADWANMVTAIEKLVVMFNALPSVVEYMLKVKEIFSTISEQVATDSPSIEFWTSIFTSDNIGSGGELEINGWITDLFYTKHPLNKIENFLSTYGVIPYKNLDSGRRFKSAHGAFAQYRDDAGYIYAGYTNVVIEMASE